MINVAGVVHTSEFRRQKVENWDCVGFPVTLCC